MLGSFSFGMMAFILPVYMKMVGGNAVAIGGLFAIFSIVTLLLRPLIGKGIDIYGRRIFLIFAFVIYGIAMLLFSYSTNMTLIYMSRLIQAIASSFMWISAYSVAIDLTDRENRGSEIGYVDGATAKGELYGAAIGFFILGFIPLLTGWSILFKFYAILSFIAAYIVYKNIPETKSLVKQTETKSESKLSKDYSKLLTIVFISAFSASMLSLIYIVYLMDRFTTNVITLAWCFIPSALVYAYLQQRLGGVSDKIGRIKPMAIGLVVAGGVSICLTVVFHLYIMVILWTLLAVGIAMASPAETALVADITGDYVRGSAYGVYTMVGSLGGAIGPIVGGVLYESLGKTAPFYVNGFLLLINALLVVVLLKNFNSKLSGEIVKELEG